MGDEDREVKKMQTVPALQASVMTIIFWEKWNPLVSAGRVI